ncbi:MAG: hypothetical protein WC026_17380 [Hyphomicrobium sp.]|uniref:hypothetical protein n=1 Tax=Hyphomicrobium sp. TaxID=82 RepID=UPI00356A2B3D
MIETLIHIVFLLIVIGVLWWAVQRIIGVLQIAEPFNTLIYVIAVVAAAFVALYIIQILLGVAGVHVAWPRL